jgi:cytosine deaminase
MTLAPPANLALRVPRSLLDPRLDLGPVGPDGLVAVRLEQRDGRISALAPLVGAYPASLPLALTPLVEPHAHLDKCYTAAAFPNYDGTMASALALNQTEYQQRSEGQVLQRAERALQRAWRQGLRAIRSHIDSVGPGARPSWEALLELRRQWADRLELQLVALAPVAHWRRPEGVELARWVADRGGLLGGVIGPPYAAGPADRQSLEALLPLAEQLGCGVDLHVDEADRQPGRGVALVVAAARRLATTVPITCSHASSLALLGEPAQHRLAEQLAAAGIAVVALPSTNAWLLRRRLGRTPLLRPQAPIHELQRAGVAVAVGGDNVQDPWFPGGDFDPIELLRFSVVAVHLHPWQRLGLAPFTSGASRVLGLAWDGVLRCGGPADLLVLAASSWPELLACTPQRRVLRGGQWLEPVDDGEASRLLPRG